MREREDPARPQRPRTLRHVAGRAVLLVAGSTLSTLCYAVTIKASLGLGPLFVLQDGLSRRLGIAIGTAVIVTGFGLVAVALALRARPGPGPGTFLLPVLGGVTLDAVLPHTPALHGWPVRLAGVVLATWLMALGGALVIRASVGIAAYDAVMLGLRRVFGHPLAPTRVAMESAALVAGWLLGGAVGIGTVVTGLLIGPGIAFWLRVLAPPDGADLRARRFAEP